MFSRSVHRKIRVFEILPSLQQQAQAKSGFQIGEPLKWQKCSLSFLSSHLSLASTEGFALPCPTARASCWSPPGSFRGPSATWQAAAAASTSWSPVDETKDYLKCSRQFFYCCWDSNWWPHTWSSVDCAGSKRLFSVKSSNQKLHCPYNFFFHCFL